ncbi:dynamin family protein [Paraburkholderia acidisoli]|uniref:Dynamin N-terminal domain-containing protein n=1 Tax=Paraburkholderia acidisoli TaxID=2571748 RepID=A0A7Z2GRM0_9BURK|nr:dynamin family protein [Paraburkholderia acidisoli]QGZ66648.1 hypothetical protein FAZ98_33380 [Paraburkholderia acidisoli]
MTTAASHEARFLREVDAFEFVARDLDAILHALETWRTQLAADLLAHRLEPAGLPTHSPLAQRTNGIHTLLSESASRWTQQRVSLLPAQSLAQAFDDCALLLVFGKFNAGKSAFCNFLADRFLALGKTVQYFHAEAGDLVETVERFCEGSTETTARLQGVRLGEKLVLLDTPGLHSVTQENAALTRRFMESADAVLWLTSSTSPGQVQELDELGNELRRGKVLMPVVTRSDMYEEDEVDGAICKVLRNKSTATRVEQEADVEARAQEKLRSLGVDVARLESPVSVSAYMARAAGHTPEAMDEAGFERLYEALLTITASTLDYKRRKYAELVLHHLEEDVLGALQRDVLPALGGLRAAAQAALLALDECETRLVNAAWRRSVPMLPALLDAFMEARDVDALSASLARAVDENFAQEAQAQLTDYADAIAQDHSASLPFTEATHFNGETIDYQPLYSALQNAIRDDLMRRSKAACDACRATVERLSEQAAALTASIDSQGSALIALKTPLREGVSS